MSLGRKASGEGASRLARARYDDRESTEGKESEARDRNARQSKLATIWQVPVGYQDETGFHCGTTPVDETVHRPGPGESNVYYF